MKRLLAYLFIVLGLGLTFNVSANHSWNEGHFCIKKKGDDGKWPFYANVWGGYDKCPNGMKEVSKKKFETFKKIIDKKYVPNTTVSTATKNLDDKKNDIPNCNDKDWNGNSISWRSCKNDTKNKITTKEISQTQMMAKLNDIDIVNTAWILDSRLFVLFLKNGKCKINERGLDVIIKNISYEGAWERYCRYEKHFDNRVELKLGNETNPTKYNLAFFEKKFIGSKAKFGLNVFKEVLNGKKPKDIYVQGVKKELTTTQMAKIEPSQKQKMTEKKVNLIFCDTLGVGQWKYRVYYTGYVNRDTCNQWGYDYKSLNYNDFRFLTKNQKMCVKQGINGPILTKKNCDYFNLPEIKFDSGKFYYNSKIKTQIAKAEPTVKPKKKVKVVKKEPKQEEFKPKKTNQDNEAPVIQIAEAITVDSQAYTLKGKVKDKSQIYLTINGRQVDVKKGRFELDRFSIDPDVAEELKIVAIDQWNNKSEKTIKVTIDLQSTDIAKVYEELKPNNVKVKTDKNKIAIIIGIEKYENLTNLDAKYANRDAKAFRTYATRALGIKPSNIKMLIDDKANRGNTLEAFKIWLPKIAGKGGKDIHIFFAGHGLASENGKDLYILPQDGNAKLLDDTAITRVELITLIQKVNPKSVTMFFDTCYSGQTRDERMLVASLLRPIQIISEEQDTPDNFTIFSASNYDQVSGGIEEAQHGMFSYYLMKGLEGNADENKDKKITNGELIAYLKDNVSEEAFTQNREQDPMLAGDPDKVLMSYR